MLLTNCKKNNNIYEKNNVVTPNLLFCKLLIQSCVLAAKVYCWRRTRSIECITILYETPHHRNLSDVGSRDGLI